MRARFYLSQLFCEADYILIHTADVDDRQEGLDYYPGENSTSPSI